MKKGEISELYARLALHYESTIDALLAKGSIDIDLATATKEKFYGSLNMVSLTELARQCFEESPGYVIQSWMRSRNASEFLRQWENDMNEEFDDGACDELIRQGHTTSLTIMPSL